VLILLAVGRARRACGQLVGAAASVAAADVVAAGASLVGAASVLVALLVPDVLVVPLRVDVAEPADDRVGLEAVELDFVEVADDVAVPVAPVVAVALLVVAGAPVRSGRTTSRMRASYSVSRSRRSASGTSSMC
jgi:hypothetical protein